MRYKQQHDGDMIYPKRKGYRFACHVLDFSYITRKGGAVRIRFTARRDNRATAAVRRGMRQRKQPPIM
jgi:hypothetical protein